MEETETLVENTEVVEEVNDIPEEAVDAFNLDALIEAQFENDPIMEGEHKIGLPYEEIIKHIPENGRKVIQNLRASYTKKTQELANERKALDNLKAELVRQQQLLTNSDWSKSINEKAQDETQHDIWDTEGRQKEIERQAAIMMQKMLAPLQQEVQIQSRELELQKFKAEHPDLSEHRLDIAKLLQQNEHLRLEDAYWQVKGRKAAEEQAMRESNRAQNRENLKKTSTGKNVGGSQMSPPKFKDAWSSYQYHKAQMLKNK